MFTYTHVRLAWSLLTTILLVLIHALPYKILIKISASPVYVDTDEECALQPARILDDQPILIHAWGMLAPIVAILVISLIPKWCASPGHHVPRGPRRSQSVLAAPRILGDSVPFSLPPQEEIDDVHHGRPHQPRYRGKLAPTSSAFKNNSSRRNVLQDQAISHPLTEERDPDPGDDDIPPAEVLAIVGLLLLFLRRFLARIHPRWIQRTDSLPPNPTPALHLALSIVASRSSSLPDPKRPVTTVQLRSQTLARGSDIPLPYPIETKGLSKSLSTGSKDLSAQDTGNISVFFVAADDELEDPNHDLGVFQGILHRPVADPTMRFSPLAGSDVTVETIRRWFIWLYLLAFLHRSRLLVFLAGRGNMENHMCLPGGASFSEDNIHKWLSEIRKQFKLRRAQTPTIILDICRAGNIPSISAGGLANMIRSCSSGEFAQAIGFESKDISRSCFYLAFFLAANDHASSPKAFKESLVRWLNQVGKLRARIHDYWHADLGECEDCKKGWICERPKPQTLEQGDDGWPDLHQLGVFIATKHPVPMHNIVDRFHQEERDIEHWSQRKKASFAAQCSQATSIVQDSSAVAQHSRGATPSVIQAESLSTIVEA